MRFSRIWGRVTTGLRPETQLSSRVHCCNEAMTITRGERFILVGMFWGEGEVAQYERSLALLARHRKARSWRHPQSGDVRSLKVRVHCGKLPAIFPLSVRFSTAGVRHRKVSANELICCAAR